MNSKSLPSPRDICRGEATFQPVKQRSSLWTSAMGLDLLFSIQLCGGRAQHPQLLVPALCQKATSWAALQYFLTYLLRINQYKEWLFRLFKPARLILVGILQKSSHNCLSCQRYGSQPPHWNIYSFYKPGMIANSKTIQETPAGTPKETSALGTLSSPKERILRVGRFLLTFAKPFPDK